MPRFPQELVNVRVAPGCSLDDAPRTREAVEAAERELGDEGRVLVRASGTEPLVRVMVEAPTPERAAAVAERLREVVAAELGAPGGP